MARKETSTFDAKAFLATVNHGRSVSDYRKDDVVYLQEGPANAVFYIQKGKIKITVASKQGKEAVIAIMGPDEFFGEGCLIGQPLRLATATAMIESRVMRVDKVEMIRVLHEEARSASSSRPICSPATAASRKTSSTSSSTRARSGWRARCSS